MVLVMIGFPALAQDPGRGAQLYENHCLACHGSVAHEREGRKARTWPELMGWVQRWQQHLQLGWSVADVTDVAAHLDERFYRFRTSTTR